MTRPDSDARRPCASARRLSAPHWRPEVRPTREQAVRWLGATLRRTLLGVPGLERGVRWASGAVARAPEQSLPGRLRVLRTALRPSADARQVLAVLDALDELGVRYWLAGGWGVDALAGRQSRAHDDVDVVLDDFDRSIGRAVAGLCARGFRVLEHDRAPTWMPDRWQLGDRFNCQVELLSLDLDRVQRAYSPDGVLGRGGLEPFSVGTIGGRAVPCLSAAAQQIVHRGYRERPSDLRDLGILRELRQEVGAARRGVGS